MLKRNKRKVLKNKIKLLYSNTFFLFQLKHAQKKNSSIQHIYRAALIQKSYKSKKNNICFFSGRVKSFHSSLKFNRTICNSFLRFNYFPNITIFNGK